MFQHSLADTSSSPLRAECPREVLPITPSAIPRLLPAAVFAVAGALLLLSRPSLAGPMPADPAFQNYVIEYAGMAPMGSMLKVTANATGTGFGGMQVPFMFGKSFDISGMTANQAIATIVFGFPVGSDAKSTPANVGPPGITITTLGNPNPPPTFGFINPKGLDLTPNAALKNIVGNFKTAAAVPRVNDALGTPVNQVIVSVDPGIDPGGATAGNITLDLNGVPIIAAVGSGDLASTVLASLETSVLGAGFAFSSPTSDSFTIDFANAQNFNKLGIPSSFQFDLGLTDGASNLDFGLGVFPTVASIIPEPSCLMIFSLGTLVLIAYGWSQRTRPRLPCWRSRRSSMSSPRPWTASPRSEHYR
jgi:hypothetical protein